MKVNKWTVSLALAGFVSPAWLAHSEEQINSVQTALASTTLSGYVDTSAQWNFGTGNGHLPPYRFGGPDKADGFNLDVVQLRLDKPLDESSWAAGYRVDLWLGPDADTLATQSVLANSSSDFAIRQAYVALRVPFCNGLDFKLGVWDSIIGYESIESPSNPNYTRSYGHSIEPTTHTGLLGSYRFTDNISVSGGIANTMSSQINSRAFMGSSGVFGGLFGTITGLSGISNGIAGEGAKAESYKTYMGSIALTAPDSWGFLSGSTLYGGAVNGYNNSVLGTGVGLRQLNAYAGATIATPVTGLRLGAAYDLLDIDTKNALGIGTIDGAIWTVAGYASYQVTEKLSAHLRGEYMDARIDQPLSAHVNIVALTTTLQYDLWKNVISRVEFRWDHCTSSDLPGNKIFGGATPFDAPTLKNAFVLAANVIYRF
jgi:hypothetical protein